jgi:hypothetical protein
MCNSERHGWPEDLQKHEGVAMATPKMEKYREKYTILL